MIVGTAGRVDDADAIEIRIAVGTPRRYRVPAGDARRVLGGYSAVLYDDEDGAIGDIATSASGRMLIGAGRAGRGFVPDGTVFPVEAAAWMIPRDHLRAHYHRYDGPVEVLGGSNVRR